MNLTDYQKPAKGIDSTMYAGLNYIVSSDGKTWFFKTNDGSYRGIPQGSQILMLKSDLERVEGKVTKTQDEVLQVLVQNITNNFILTGSAMMAMRFKNDKITSSDIDIIVDCNDTDTIDYLKQLGWLRESVSDALSLSSFSVQPWGVTIDVFMETSDRYKALVDNGWLSKDGKSNLTVRLAPLNYYLRNKFACNPSKFFKDMERYLSLWEGSN